MEVRTEHADRGLKRRMKLLLSLFIGALVLLTIYSNTLLTMNLPKVWVEEGSVAPLVQNYSGSGILQPASVVELSNQAGWKITTVLVKEGDHVSKGQILATYDSREADNRIRDEQANQERQRLMMEGLQDRYIEAAQSGEEIKIRSAKRDIDVARVEMGVQERRVRTLQEDLTRLCAIAAPFDGVITKVNAVQDLSSGSAGPDVRISNASLGYQLALPIPSSITEQLKLGDKQTVQVRINGVNRAMESTLADIKNLEAEQPAIPVGEGREGSAPAKSISQKRVLLTLQGEELQGGEQASVQIDKTAANEKGMLVPNKAIHGEGTNAFIYVLEEKKGPLGNTYHATKAAIQVGESNEHSTVVLKGAYPGLSIIMESSEPLQDGSRVRLK